MAHQRRAMSMKEGLTARSQQAAQDALRRRQKMKKARTVRRHVRYKEKQRLLKEVEAAEGPKLIVAAELGFPMEEEDGDVEKEGKSIPRGKKQVQRTSAGVNHENDKVLENEEGGARSEAFKGEDEDERKDAEGMKKEQRTKKTYLPFTKQMRQAEKAREEREMRERERQERIKMREKMLKKSRKQRNEKSKQYRAVTSKGQPKLKHRLEAMLAQIQKT